MVKISWFLLFAFVFLGVKNLYPQNTGSKKADSLRNLLNTNYPIADTNRARVLMNLFSANMATEPDSSLEQMALEIIDISTKNNWLTGLAKGNQYLGLVYGYFRGNYPKGMTYYNKALTENSKTFPFDSATQSSIYNNIGMLFFDTRQFQKSLETYKKAIAVKPARLKDAELETRIYINVANPLAEMGNHDSALAIYEKYGPSFKGNAYYPVLLSNKAQVLNMLGRHSESRAVFTQAYELTKNQNAGLPKLMALMGLSVTEVRVGSSAVAMHYAKMALALSDSLGSLLHRSLAYEVMAIAYRKQGQHAKALEAFDQFVILRDSVTNETKIQELAFLEASGEFDRNLEIEKVKHEAQIKQQKLLRNAMLGGLALVFLAGITLFVSYKKRKEVQTLQLKAQLQAEITDFENKALRAQMNPHFIFNALNSIADFMFTNPLEETNKYLIKFSKLMRRVLENSEHKIVSLGNELEALTLYIELEQLRSQHRFTFTINVADNVDVELAEMPPLILQPFVENSIWHGLSKRIEQGHLNIDICINEEKQLVCKIADNGVGIHSTNLNEGHLSLGLKVTRARIHNYKPEGLPAGEIVLRNLSPGLEAVITIPQLSAA